MDSSVLNAHSENSNRSRRLSGRPEASLGAQSNCWFIVTHRLVCVSNTQTRLIVIDTDKESF